MGGEVVSESWLSNLWRGSRRNASHQEKTVVGILAFEVASLMSKIVSFWNSLSDKQIVRLREDVANSLGVLKLVSEDENLLMELAFSEIIENLACVGRSVSRLGKRCSDPIYHHLEQFFEVSINSGVELNRRKYSGKKMGKKVKKMERFVAATSQLYQEMEVLVELEQTLRRMQTSPETSQVKLLEFQQKVLWQRQEVKSLREMSPWSRTYDYIVRLMARSIFTIIERLEVVIGVNQVMFVEERNVSGLQTTGSLPRSRSLMQSSVHPSENQASIFYSGPLAMSSSKLGLTTGNSRTRKKQQQRAPDLNKKPPFIKTKIFVQSGPFNGCMIGGSESPVIHSCMPSSSSSIGSAGTCSYNMDKMRGTISAALSISNTFQASQSILRSQSLLSDILPCSLGRAGLSLHYANIIILIERFASSPHLIGADARDDLYSMLPTSIRTALRARLKLYPKSFSSSAYDATLAAEWSLAVARMLEWLSPLAHNMVRWHSERNFEKQHMVPAATVLLVQTLHFADQAKAEAAITELLMGLNYLCRFGEDVNQKASLGATGNRAFNDYSIQNDAIACNA
ncbi:hypothetical protein Ancab_031735 [Ancistrocladus abbreviatus]